MWSLLHTFRELTGIIDNARVYAGMQLDYITVLFCAKDDVIIVPITSACRAGGDGPVGQA